ncbi:MAG: MmcQ/YjbR family DNA-binding protein [Candidatus Thiodiazotropha sp. (ex Lucinoma borealis)]|nr:MmcQ/YjbR family DNA-binding protein [Candidatus Thiodiazotropha sp. (ex Lucinoma borealis)]MCU7857193.1 MmcQ/YjbR family DNA-binding protein [Candidatus Thiodiazotropha sp. (ex Lucinoma borealis)]MCU7868747.1 MmcQ/YjbR family DNA-binding protein [Candidatus Thiodiazotropha sp. (ex Lucinoma borealis)]
MNKSNIEKYLARFKGMESSSPFGLEALVFKVMNKMFALVSQLEEPARVTLKCRPANVETLVAQYESIIPGYYMNKKHWITVSLTDEIPDQMLIDLADESYRLVVANLTRKEREKLQQ